MIFKEDGLVVDSSFKVLTNEKDIHLVDNFKSLLDTISGDPELMLKTLILNKIEGKKNNGLKIIHWPDTIIKSKTANCVDISIMVHYYLNHFNYENYMVFLFYQSVLRKNAMSGHCVPIFKTAYGYWIFDFLDYRIFDIHGPFGTLENAAETAINYYLTIFRSLVQYNNYSPFSNPIDDFMVGDYFSVNFMDMLKMDKYMNKEITQQELVSKFSDKYPEMLNRLQQKVDKEYSRYMENENHLDIIPKYLPKKIIDFSNISLRGLDITKIKNTIKQLKRNGLK